MLFGIIITVGAVVLVCKRSFDLTNPLFFLWTTWLAALLICLGNVFTAYPPLSTRVLALIGAYLGVVTIANLLGRYLHLVPTPVSYHRASLQRAFNLLVTLVVLADGVTILRLGLPPLFSGVSRATYYLSGGGELVYLLIYPAFFLAFFMLQQGMVPLRAEWPQLTLLGAIVITRANKMTIFAILLMAVYFFGRRVRVNRLLVMGGVVIGIFLLVAVTYKKNVADLAALKQARIAVAGFSLPEQWYFLYDPFIYLSSNLNNLNSEVVNHLRAIGQGSLTFKGLWQGLAPLYPPLTADNTRTLATINSSLDVPSFSTYSGLGILYYDFGPWLSLEIMAVIGFVAGFLKTAATSPQANLTTSFTNFLLFQTLALSFFTFYLGNLEVVTNLFVIWLIDHATRKGAGGIYLE